MPTPVFHEIAESKFVVGGEDKINQSIKISSKNLSHLPHITQSFINEYLVYIHEANKHKISGKPKT